MHLAFICIILIYCNGSSEAFDSKLEARFLNPPDNAKPRVWWQWMNSNVTNEGIKSKPGQE